MTGTPAAPAARPPVQSSAVQSSPVQTRTAQTSTAPTDTDPTPADPTSTPDLAVEHGEATAPAANPTVTAATLVTATVVAGAVAAAATAATSAPAPARTPVPRQRPRGRRRPAPAPVSLGSLTQREHRPDTSCSSCGSSSVTSLSMTLADGTPTRFASCRTCGHRTWEGDDGVMGVSEVLTRSTRDPR